MDRVLRKIQGMTKEELKEMILERYYYVWRNYGRKIFEEKVLPEAFEVYHDSSLLVLEAYRIIQISKKYLREYKKSEIEEYLLSVVSEFNEQNR